MSYNGGATSILAGTGRNVTFEFKMPEILTVDGVVQPVEVALANLEPNEEDYPDELKFNNSKGVYEYIPSTDTAEGKQTLHLKTINSETVKVELNSYHYLTASLEAPRRRGKFENVFFTQGTKTVTTLSSTASQEVTLNFDMSDYEDGMIVNVVLDGFTPVDDALKPLATRESVNYTYEPNPKQSGRHSITLKTEAGATECNVTLSVKGMTTNEYQWGNGTLTQRDIKTYDGTLSVTVNNINIQHNQNNQNPKPTITIKSVDVNGAENISYSSGVTNIEHQARQFGRKYTLSSASFDIKDIVVSGSSMTDNTAITIVVTIRYGNTSRDFTVEYKLSDIN